MLPAQAPEVALVRPWTLKRPSQFRVAPPPDLTSNKWARDYNETKSLGVATGSTRTPEQTDLARFVSDQPMLQWNRAWRGISVAQQMSLVDNARFFAMLTTASSDALIACWDSKFFYNFWRPVTAIRAGDSDGNPETDPDPNWIGLVNTPNHPEYPAAHGCFSGASTETLKFFFGTDRFDFTMDSMIAGLTNPVRHYTRFSQALDDALDARIYGGMHYRNSTRKGAIIGKRVSHFATGHFFRPFGRAIHDAGVLTLDSTRYCVGDYWSLKVTNAEPNAPIRLIGTSNDTSWEIPNWANTDASGNFGAAGTFDEAALGSHTVRIEIGGSVSNTLFFDVANRKQ